MKREIKLIVVSLILLVMSVNISYAIAMTDTSSFFEVNKTEVTQGETLEMTIDLSKVNYSQFEFVLNANVEIENVYMDETNVDDSDIKLDKESDDIVINIDKDKLNLNQIVLYYQIPEDVEVGTKIQLNAQVKVENDVIENQENKDIEDIESEIQEAKTTVVYTRQIEVTIVKENKNQDENKSDNKNENNGNEEIKNSENNRNEEQQGNQSNETESKNQSGMQNMQDVNSNQVAETASGMQNMQDTNSNQVAESTSGMQSMSNSVGNATTSVIQVETATYNGSNNNYLSSLEIDGVQLTTDFSKEKSTYFTTVEGLETITVTADAEDSNSKVAITGTILKSGENKVLISVTAENGDVRYYRIYVTNN